MSSWETEIILYKRVDILDEQNKTWENSFLLALADERSVRVGVVSAEHLRLLVAIKIRIN